MHQPFLGRLLKAPAFLDSVLLGLMEDGATGHPPGDHAALLPDAWAWSGDDLASTRYFLAAMEFDVLDQGMNRNGYVINFGSETDLIFFNRVYCGSNATLRG